MNMEKVLIIGRCISWIKALFRLLIDAKKETIYWLVT